MNRHSKSTEEHEMAQSPGLFLSWSKRTLFEMFNDLRFGRLMIDNCGQHYSFGNTQAENSPTVNVVVHNQRFYPDVLFKGSLGAAESYMK